MPIAGLLLKLNGFYHKLDRRLLNGVKDRKNVVEEIDN
jgi:hypothetical protein